MTTYSERRVLPYTPRQIFDLVAEVDRYRQQNVRRGSRDHRGGGKRNADDGLVRRPPRTALPPSRTADVPLSRARGPQRLGVGAALRVDRSGHANQHEIRRR